MSLQPVKRSGAPHSSTLMCAVEAQTTASCGRMTEARPQTLAPVPPKTKKTSADTPNCSRNFATAAAVKGSSP